MVSLAKTAKEAARKAVEELYPWEVRWFDPLWDVLWDLAEKAGTDLATLDRAYFNRRIVSEIGFAEAGVDAGLDSLPLVGVVISFTVDLGAKRLPALTLEQVKERIQTFSEVWQAPETTKSVIERIAHGIVDMVKVEKESVKTVGQMSHIKESKPYAVVTHYAPVKALNSADLDVWLAGIDARSFDVWLDESTRYYRIKEQTLRVRGKPLATLEELLMAYPRGLSTEELFEKVYPEKYDPLVDGPRVVNNVSHVRLALRKAKFDADAWVPDNQIDSYLWQGPTTFCIIFRLVGLRRERFRDA